MRDELKYDIGLQVRTNRDAELEVKRDGEQDEGERESVWGKEGGVRGKG